MDADPKDPDARAPVLREAGLPERPPAGDGRDRAALVLVQQPVRRLPGVHGSGHPARGRPRAARPGRRADPRRGRDRAVDPGLGGVLPAADGGARRPAGLLHGRAVAGAAGAGEGGPAARRELRGARPVPQPVRPRALVHHRLRGRDPVRPAPALRDRVGVEPGAVRGLHARGAVPGVRRRPAQARVARGAARRAVDLRGVRQADRGVRAVPRRAQAHGARDADRRAGAQGDPGAARVPARRRARLPVARPRVGHAVRRRGAADPAGHPDRLRPGRRALRAGRAEHRAAPARQPPADRDADPAARPGQHPDRRRARRGHHPARRLDRRHRSRRRRARRPRGALGDGGGAAHPQGVADRAYLSGRREIPLPAERRPVDGDREITVVGAREHNLQRHRRVVPAGVLRRGHRGVRARASRRWSTTSSTTCWPTS